jgi:hypothetical protein
VGKAAAAESAIVPTGLRRAYADKTTGHGKQGLVNPIMRMGADRIQESAQILQLTGALPVDFEQLLDAGEGEIDLALVNQLCNYAAEQHKAGAWGRDAMDAWLAPRLHSAIRIDRRTAADHRFWAWLAMQNATYIRARFARPDGKPFRNWRYTGDLLRNGLSRLWWGAEMTRNGCSYVDVERCFGGVRTAQFALELRYSWSRAAAIAFARVVEGADGSPRLSDREKKKLSTTLRVILALRALEASALEEIDDSEEFDSEWASHMPSFAQLRDSATEELRGPTTGVVSEQRVLELSEWFRQLAQEYALDEPGAEAVPVGANSDEDDSDS